MSDLLLFRPETIVAYTRCYTPEQLHAVCEDYRAGATIDFDIDRADVEAGHTIQCPVLVSWDTQSHTEKMFGPRLAWPPYTGPVPEFCPLPWRTLPCRAAAGGDVYGARQVLQVVRAD